MKISIKNSIYLLALPLVMFSCLENTDNVTANASDEAALVSLGESSGKILGIPSASGIVTYTDVELSVDVKLDYGNLDAIKSFTIIKSYNESVVQAYAAGRHVEIETVNALPYNGTYSSIEEFVEGFKYGSTTNDLIPDSVKIGDFFEISVILTTKSNATILPNNNGRLRLTVNCASALAGSYTLTGTRDTGETYSFPATVTETAPGQYLVSRSGHWALGALATPSGEATLVFNDVCGQLSIPQQYLGNYYSNLVYGIDDIAGSVDGATGIITYEYIIEFAAGNRSYVDVLTPN